MIKFEPLPSDDPRQRQPDISKAKAILEWEPKTQLREGLAKTIDYFDKMLSKEGTSAFARRRNKMASI
jgi:UDP-glucuronate decarboxylase